MHVGISPENTKGKENKMGVHSQKYWVALQCKNKRRGKTISEKEKGSFLVLLMRFLIVAIFACFFLYI